MAGELSDVAKEIIATMDTLTEISPSDTGVKILCLGTIPRGAGTTNKAKTVEVYGGGRYFTITSRRVEGTPKRVEARQEQLSAVHAKYIGSEQAKPKAATSHSTNGHTTDALEAMLRIRTAPNESDGSNRLLAVCCRCVEHDLSDAAAVATIRKYERARPFPADWTDDDILRRLRDAERKAERGAALESASRHTTDCGNGERFAEQHGADVRYCHPWGKWLVWDGRRWPIDASGEVMRRAKRTARSIFVEASHAVDKDTRDALAKWASASERRERLTAMIALAQSEQPIPVAVEHLDAEPWLLNCENGTIDLRTGELREHRREDYLTKLCPLEYPTEPGIDPELWLTFLDRICDGSEPKILFLRRLIGMALVGEVLENILPIFYGAGANGKSVFLETICSMLGSDYAMAAGTSLLMVDRAGRHPTERTDLHGRRFVAANESGDGGRLSEETVKQLTSREGIRARRMREDSWEFKPSHTVVLATNHKPTIRGTDHGIWRRIQLVPFNVTIPEPERDSELANKLQAEWPAILRWAVAGCLDWQRNGLLVPGEVLDATDDYRNEQDILGEFLEERCIVGEGCSARAGDLYKSYSSWAADRGEYAHTQTRFGTQLGERGFKNKRNTKDGRKEYHGVGLLPEGGGADANPEQSEQF